MSVGAAIVKKKLQAVYANLHTDQERDSFMQRYHDVISSFGGKNSYDSDNRPLLIMRSNLCASGYDVDGTEQPSLGQFYVRCQQTYKHSVPRIFVPRHGTILTLALVRFPPIFFFQAEDGIRDYKVTGVQTCALPISGIRPDFICLSKGLTGGTLALSAVLTTETVYAAFYDDSVARGFLHSHSYTGNPLACRAALATLELFEQTDAINANLALAQRLDGAFAPLNQHARVRHARRQGMIWAWDVQTSLPDFSRRYSAEIGRASCRERV